MALVIATEAALFASLFFAWAFLKHDSSAWSAHPAPDLLLPGINTALLLASSVVLEWAPRGRRALALAIALGATFAVVQGWEYTRLAFGPATDAYGSAFIVMTGIHGVHVLAGLLMLGFVALTWRRQQSGTPNERLRIASLYWHFVDLVWLVLFSVLYLAPHAGL